MTYLSKLEVQHLMEHSNACYSLKCLLQCAANFVKIEVSQKIVIVIVIELYTALLKVSGAHDPLPHWSQQIGKS